MMIKRWMHLVVNFVMYMRRGVGTNLERNKWLCEKKRCVRFDILGLDVETCVALAFLGVLLASKPVVDSFLGCPTGWFDEGFRDLVPERACYKTHKGLSNRNRLDWLLIIMDTTRPPLDEPFRVF